MNTRKHAITCLFLLLICSCRSMRSNDDRLLACRTELYKPVVDTYGEQGCVLVLIESDRQHDLMWANMLSSGTHHTMQPIPSAPSPMIMNSLGQAQPVYGSQQCTGSTVNGACGGSVIGNPVAICHGEMLGGQCTGPMF